MNDPRSTNSQLDRYVNAALERFADLAPEPDPWPLLWPVDPTAGDGGRRWVVSAAAAAVGVAGVGGVIAVTGDDASAPVGGAPDSVGTDSTTVTTAVVPAAANQPRCGTAPPAMIEFAVPFTGPVEATAGEALVQRWEFEGGSVALTWPAADTTPEDAWNDAAETRFEWTEGVGDEGVPFIGIDVGGDQAASPGDGYGGSPENVGLPADFIYDVVIGLLFSGEVAPLMDADDVPWYADIPACDFMQLDVQDSTGNVERWLISLSGGPNGDDYSPTLIGVMVDAGGTTINAPHAFEDAASGCNVVSGVPLRDSNRHTEPIAALASFLESDQGRHLDLPVTGWQQQLEVNDEPDRFWFVQPLEDVQATESNADVYAAVVTVERQDDGWAVSAYELTCG